MLTHPFAPVYDEHSEILILGTFPSVKSRENDFYYGHPQNRFWKVLAAVFGDKGCAADNVTYMAGSDSSFTAGSLHHATIDEKKAFLLQNHIALWDVIECCEITGSADSTITNVTANDIAGLLAKVPVRKIFCNGNKAWELFQKYILPRFVEKNFVIEKSLSRADFVSPAVFISEHNGDSKIKIIRLPSTSPANAAWSLEKLIAEWKKLL